MTSACATITTGTSHTMTVTTEPPGAACILARDGATVGAVNPTPGSVTISKSTRDLAVTCTRDGYAPAVQSVSASFQPATLGNLLLGGVVGIIVDASSGAANRYPDAVALSLQPVPAPLPPPLPPMTMEPIPDPPPRRAGRGRVGS